MPIALLAERLLCQRMGVVEEGEKITEAAISKFVALFHGQLPGSTATLPLLSRTHYWATGVMLAWSFKAKTGWMPQHLSEDTAMLS